MLLVGLTQTKPSVALGTRRLAQAGSAHRDEPLRWGGGLGREVRPRALTALRIGSFRLLKGNHGHVGRATSLPTRPADRVPTRTQMAAGGHRSLSAPTQALCQRAGHNPLPLIQQRHHHIKEPVKALRRDLRTRHDTTRALTWRGPLAAGVAAVDGEADAGDHGGLVAEQERYWAGDVVLGGPAV
jgi:hypothetical protein